MDFDIVSMKQRAKELIKDKNTKANMFGTIQMILFIAYFIVLCILIMNPKEEVFLLGWVILEIVISNFRNCSTLYGLKVSRDEKASMGDMFLAFKEKPVTYILNGIMKEILYLMGLLFFFVGIIFPIYWFRFSAYIIKDEECNFFAALSKSMKLLKGHYAELMKLDISNIVWIVLPFFTMGITEYSYRPLLSIVYAEYYDHLKAQSEMGY